jgi:hypothetical protein
MKTSFSGYIDDFLESNILGANEAIVAFDTNILLNLYRVEVAVSNDILSQLKHLIDNDFFEVWLPHQVALEFNTLRKSTLRAKNNSVNVIASEFKTFKKKLEGLAKVGGKNGEIYPLKIELGEHFHAIDNVIKKHSPKNSSHKTKDSVSQVLFDIFDGKVGEPYTKEQMSEVESDADYRFKNKIPPGFDDSGKDESYSFNGINISAKYGDYILWRQLIEYAKKRNKTVILVTADTKPDWQSKDFNRVRPELITEFKLKTKQDFYALTLNEFEYRFGTHLQRNLSLESTSQIKELNKRDNAGWLEDILGSFHHFSRQLTLKEIYTDVKKNSKREEFPPTWETIIRRTIYNHCSDVTAYLGKEDFFQQIESGVYKLRDNIVAS